jgi:hypothetical protein
MHQPNGGLFAKPSPKSITTHLGSLPVCNLQRRLNL